MSLHKYNTNQPDMQYRCLTFPMLCPVHSRITLASVTPLSRQALRHSGVSDAGVMRTKAGESRALPPPCPCQDVVSLLSAQAVNRLSPEMSPTKKSDREREGHRRGGRCHPDGDWEARV